MVGLDGNEKLWLTSTEIVVDQALVNETFNKLRVKEIDKSNDDGQQCHEENPETWVESLNDYEPDLCSSSLSESFGENGTETGKKRNSSPEGIVLEYLQKKWLNNHRPKGVIRPRRNLHNSPSHKGFDQQRVKKWGKSPNLQFVSSDMRTGGLNETRGRSLEKQECLNVQAVYEKLKNKKDLKGTLQPKEISEISSGSKTPDEINQLTHLASYSENYFLRVQGKRATLFNRLING